MIKVKNLTKRFVNTAVDEVSFDVRKGDVLAFLGPNGARKSTTIKMISGSLTSGGGKDIKAILACCDHFDGVSS